MKGIGWKQSNQFLFRKMSDREKAERKAKYDHVSVVLKSVGNQARRSGEWKPLSNFQIPTNYRSY
jgi:hypothetical protein